MENKKFFYFPENHHKHGFHVFRGLETLKMMFFIFFFTQSERRKSRNIYNVCKTSLTITSDSKAWLIPSESDPLV